MRKVYTSDVSREQFELIIHDLENFREITRPRKVDLYDVFCAILYLLKNGCSWRNIPGDFPHWTKVRYYYEIWTAKDSEGFSLLDYVMAKLVDTERYKTRQNPV
ncbi:MAG: transposase, partial [Defluviitaleaceae bacterium]|nr:transposase [Defluviitaleaceae bacterium]